MKEQQIRARAFEIMDAVIDFICAETGCDKETALRHVHPDWLLWKASSDCVDGGDCKKINIELGRVAKVIMRIGPAARLDGAATVESLNRIVAAIDPEEQLEVQANVGFEDITPWTQESTPVILKKIRKHAEDHKI